MVRFRRRALRRRAWRTAFGLGRPHSRHLSMIDGASLASYSSMGGDAMITLVWSIQLADMACERET